MLRKPLLRSRKSFPGFQKHFLGSESFAWVLKGFAWVLKAFPGFQKHFLGSKSLCPGSESFAWVLKAFHFTSGTLAQRFLNKKHKAELQLQSAFSFS